MGVLMALDIHTGNELQNDIQVALGRQRLTKTITDDKYYGDQYDDPLPQSGIHQWYFRQPEGGWPLFDPNDDAANPVSGYSADFNQSAFDFKPVRSNHIQFRPCNMELYSNHAGGGSYNTYIDGNTLTHNQGGVSNRDYIFNYLTGKFSDGAGPAGASSWVHSITALSAASIEETQTYKTVNGITRDNYIYMGKGNRDGRDSRGFQGAGHLTHGVDFWPHLATPKFHNSDRVAPHNYYENFNIVNSRFRKNAGSAKKGGLYAVGVIGAVCTVEAVQGVSFTTQNRIGMISWFRNKHWYPAWGGSTFNRYDKFGTTDLSVRIYQAHPREDLIYDSRFFAVHHFNPGNEHGDSDFKLPADTDGDGFTDANCSRSLTHVDIRIPSYLDFEADCNIAADKASDPNAGFGGRTPTSAAAGSVNAFRGFRYASDGRGDTIYRDVVHEKSNADANDGFGGVNRLIPSGFWNLDLNRRGKLLPYTYKNIVLQSPWFEFGFFANRNNPTMRGKIWAASVKMPGYDLLPVEAGQGAGTDFPALEIVDPSDPTKYVMNDQPITNVDFVVKNLGKDYKVGDRFTILGFEDSEVTVESVAVSGMITGLSFRVDKDNLKADWMKLGRNGDKNMLMDFKPTFTDPDGCADYSIRKRLDGDPDINRITRSSSGPARLKPYNKFSVSGKGFDAYVTKGVLRTFIATDAKPQIATISDFHQLSLPADNRPGGTAGGAIDLFGFNVTNFDNKFITLTEGERVVSADFDPAKTSPSGLYDCFFHFHNDITHTVLNNQNIASAHNSYDQYIDLIINPV